MLAPQVFVETLSDSGRGGHGQDLLRKLEIKNEISILHRAHIRFKGTYKGLGLAVVIDLHVQLLVVGDDFEREVFM